MLHVVMWAGGISFSLVAAASGFVINQFSTVDDINRQQSVQITANTTRLERLPIVEAKLDALLQANGIKPSSIHAPQLETPIP